MTEEIPKKYFQLKNFKTSQLTFHNQDLCSNLEKLSFLSINTTSPDCLPDMKNVVWRSLSRAYLLVLMCSNQCFADQCLSFLILKYDRFWKHIIFGSNF